MTDLEIIDEIQKVRNKNNVNWMDILKIAFTYAPEETRKIFKRITNDDNVINELSKKLAHNNSILLIGPGESVKDLDLNTPHLTLAFSGNFRTFQDVNFIPNYYSFLDPNTLTYLYNDYKQEKFSSGFLKDLKEKTVLIYNDFQINGTFYNYGFTTSRGKEWMDNEFKNEIFPSIKSLFKESIQINSVLTNDYLIDYQEEILKIFKHDQKHTIIKDPDDKFSKFLLPLIFCCFPNVNNIYSIGFGDFESPRYNCSIKDTNDYKLYKESFDEIKPKLSNYLIQTRKKITFLNPQSYFNQL